MCVYREKETERHTGKKGGTESSFFENKSKTNITARYIICASIYF